MESALYVGEVEHRRFRPVRHEFRQRLFMLYLDTAELSRVFEGRWLWGVERRAAASFWRADHFGDPHQTLDAAVRDLVAQRLGRRPTGPVRLLTHLRTFGYCFNPIALHYCFDDDGELDAVVGEVTNTPWNERHCYVLDAKAEAPRRDLHRFRSPKRFHVSPFMGMDMDYDWRISRPGDDLHVGIVNREQGRPLFEASLALERREISGAALAGALARFPFITGQVWLGIRWQALRLKLRGAPDHPHPDSIESQEVIPA